MNIDISKSMLPHYWPILNDESFFEVLYGGRRGGKSRAIAQKIIYRIITEGGHNVSVIRSTASSNTQSTYTEIKDVIEQFDITNLVEATKAPPKFIFKKFNSEINFYGCDDPEKLKGLHSTIIWFEELTEIKEDDFDTIIAGFSPKQGTKYAQILISFNPVSELHWVKKRFFDTDDKDVFTLHSTYKHNKYIPAKTVEFLEKLKTIDKYKYEVSTLGMWGRLNSGGNYYKNFDYNRHVSQNARYKINRPIHISFDFNIHPGLAMIIMQTENNDIFIIDELTAVDPANTISGACNMFLNKYGSHPSGIIVHGDPSGKRSNYEDHKNLFDIIRHQLQGMNPKMEIIAFAPSLLIRQQWFNYLFSTANNEFNITINPKCKELIDDFVYLQETETGGKEKTKVKKNNIRYEERGHWSDAFDYAVLKVKWRNWRKFQKGGALNRNIIIPTRQKSNFNY